MKLFKCFLCPYRDDPMVFLLSVSLVNYIDWFSNFKLGINPTPSRCLFYVTGFILLSMFYIFKIMFISGIRLLFSFHAMSGFIFKVIIGSLKQFGESLLLLFSGKACIRLIWLHKCLVEVAHDVLFVKLFFIQIYSSFNF